MRGRKGFDIAFYEAERKIKPMRGRERIWGRTTKEDIYLGRRKGVYSEKGVRFNKEDIEYAEEWVVENLRRSKGWGGQNWKVFGVVRGHFMTVLGEGVTEEEAMEEAAKFLIKTAKSKEEYDEMDRKYHARWRAFFSSSDKGSLKINHVDNSAAKGAGISRILRHIQNRNFGIVTAYLREEERIKLGEKDWIFKKGGVEAVNEGESDKLSTKCLHFAYGYIELGGRWVSKVGERKPYDSVETACIVVGREGCDTKWGIKYRLAQMCGVFDQASAFVSLLDENGKRESYTIDRNEENRRCYGDVNIKTERQLKDLVEKYLKELEEIRDGAEVAEKRFIFEDELKVYLDWKNRFKGYPKGCILWGWDVTDKKRRGEW